MYICKSCYSVNKTNKCIKCKNECFECDSNIASIISKMNKFGYKTKHCCEGHYKDLKEGILDPYIVFDDNPNYNYWTYKKFLKGLKYWKYDISKIANNKFFENNQSNIELGDPEYFDSYPSIVVKISSNVIKTKKEFKAFKKAYLSELKVILIRMMYN